MAKGQHQNKEWNREATKEETLEYLVRATSRLSRHLTAHFDGDFAAIDDVAAILRTLCGDGLIKRAIDCLELTDPSLLISKPPELSKGTHISIGNFPCSETYAKPSRPEHQAPRPSTLLTWLQSPAAYITETSKRGGKEHTSQRMRPWSGLIADISNTWGSHASPLIPPWMDTSQVIGVQELDLPGYVIERAAVAVEVSLTLLMQEVDLPEMAPAPRLGPTRPAHVDWLDIRRVDKERLHIDLIAGTDDGVPDGLYKLIRVEYGTHSVGFDLLRIDDVDMLRGFYT